MKPSRIRIREGFQGGTQWVSGAASTSRSALAHTLCFPLLHQRPINQREKGAIVGYNGIMVQKQRHHVLVKEGRRRYHSIELLFWVEVVIMLILCKRSLISVKKDRTCRKKRIWF